MGEISHILDVTASPTVRRTPGASGALTLALEDVYRENVASIAAFFARRCTEPQIVADLTSQTFVEAIASAHTYAGRGSPRAWLFAIARATYARHCADRVNNTQMVQRLGGQLRWDEDELQDIVERIDAQRQGRKLLERAACLPEAERAAFELVDLGGLSPTEAARTLGVHSGALRVRLFRARTRLRKEAISDHV